MKITIQGQDYTAALDAAHPLTIERKLNEPSVCQFRLSLPSNGSLLIPARYSGIAILGDDGTIYFTGYIAVAPLPEYAGLALEGPRYRIAIHALSDEILLDQLSMPPSAGVIGLTVGELLSALVARTGSSALSTSGLGLATPVAHFAPAPGVRWSAAAAQAASQARSAYRAVNGALLLSAAASVVHPLNEADGSLNLAALSLTASVRRALANDVTVCGEREPAAYVTEYFLGDGVTTQFYLAQEPYFPPSSQTAVLHELFNEPRIDERIWGSPGPGGYISLGAGGLVMNGGNGYDGAIALALLDPIEMGGAMLLESAGVTLAPGSVGNLCGFFNASLQTSDSVAAFHASAAIGTGAVTLQPYIQGTPAGSTFAIDPSNQYTLRVRFNAPELQREQAVYRSFGDSGPIAFGGAISGCGARIQMEIQEFVGGVGGTPVTLYDGSIADLPAPAYVVAASSINLIGSMRSLRLTNLGSGWVVATPSHGSPCTRRIGSVAQAGECHIDRTGKLVFYAGFAPPAGEQIAVSYRTVGRAIGRWVNTESQAALVAAGMPSVSTWIGTVTNPAARSSADCRNAAQAIAQAAAGVSALWSGTYLCHRSSFASDVWPGDALLLDAPSTSLNAQVVTRSVKLTYRSSYPDLVEYAIQFANDWAEDLAIETSAAVPADAWLPAPAAPAYLPNLNNLTVTTMTGSAVTINAGITPPPGGGFEVRRRDFAFMPGSDPDLVARATVPTITFARESTADRFYIRMYDGSSPPNYSEFSTALFINLPLGS